MSGLLQRLALRLDASFNAKHAEPFKRGWAATSRDDVSFFETDRVLFRYRLVDGPAGASTIVFSADPPVSLEQYDDLLELASRDFRVVVFELPGMGFSPGKRRFRFGFEETNDEVAKFLREIAGQDACLAFSCGAGLAAVDIANRHSDLAGSLVLIQTADVASFARWKQDRDPKGVLAKPIVGQYAMRRIARDRMPDWFKLALGRSDHEPSFCGCSGQAMDEGALWSLASAYQVYLRPDLNLAPVGQPVLSLWGETDGSHPPEHHASTRNLAHTITERKFEDLGHFPELQEPGRVYPVIRDWLLSLSRQA